MAACLGAVAIAFACWLVFLYLPNHLFSTDHLPKADWLKARNDIRTAGIQLLAVAAVAGGGLLTWRTIRLTREGQITDRYAKAIEQLGSESLETTLGAIYALERIARDSRRDHWRIMGLLISHLRRRAQWPCTDLRDSLANGPDRNGSRHGWRSLSWDWIVGVIQGDRSAKEDRASEPTLPLPEVAAIADVIRDRKSGYETAKQRLDLSGIDFRSTTLTGADLRGANLSESNLSGAFLETVDLTDAKLIDTKLVGARMDAAKANGADLTGADLSHAYVDGTDFANATFVRTTFTEIHVDGTEKGLPASAVAQAQGSAPS